MIERDKQWWARMAQREGNSEVGVGSSVLDNLEEDSEAFTEEEVKTALICQNEAQMIAHIRSQVCPQCQGPVETTRCALRRKTGMYYSKMTLGCLERHVSIPLVVRTDWLF